MRSTGNNTYSTSTGERLKKSVIDKRVRKAKELSIEQLNKAVADGKITIDEMVSEFRKHLENTFNGVKN